MNKVKNVCKAMVSYNRKLEGYHATVFNYYHSYVGALLTWRVWMGMEGHVHSWGNSGCLRGLELLARRGASYLLI